MAQKQATQGKRQTARLPLLGPLYNRGHNPDKDQRFLNAFPETVKTQVLDNTKISIHKRPGLVEFCNVAPDGEGRGLIWFNSALWCIIANKLYRVSSDGLNVTEKYTFTTSTGTADIHACNSSTVGDSLFIVDGIEGLVVKDDDSVTKITDVNFPTPHRPSITFLDGYVVLAKGSDVYTCLVNDPFTWPTSDYLTAEQFPDPVISLARQNNQIIVFGSMSTEFFYDAANAAGSPLNRNDAGVIQIGIAAPSVVYQNEQFCMFVGQSESGGRAVWKIDGFKPTKISDEYIERIIDAEGDMSGCHGYGLRTMGHLFFLINLPKNNRTIVYDTDEKLWHEWSSFRLGATPHDTDAEHHIFDYNHVADAGLGYAYMLSSVTGDIYKVDPNYYKDENDPIQVLIRTNKYDMDTYNRKFPSSARVVGDRYTKEQNNYVFLSWSDDDYETWSNEKVIELTDDFPAFQRLGSFRRRAWRITHDLPLPLRLESLEVIYEEGTS